MDKHKRKQKGITLISLVISVIVMLILAGVALNAAIGDNGIISQAQYATFLNEMAAVEEAVALWKINQKESAIPANGLCQEETLSVATNKNAERLNGEVGYYRVWSMSETMPAISVLADVETFNNNFGAEVVYFPAGAQDLYYLDNEGLGIDSKKEYIIDAVNSMVYSTTGITVKGVRVYSTAMAKAVMNGTIEAPLFAEAEVSGTGAGENLAGNVQDEYLPDGTKNPDYNPYGFEIITQEYSSNIYKLYNNGDLYGKGIKGLGLDSSAGEIEAISSNKWNKLTIPTEIGNYKKIKVGNGTIYAIDEQNNLWAWGSNKTNKLGLNSEEIKEYTERDAIRLNIVDETGNKVEIKDVYDSLSITWIISTENEIYVSGTNNNGVAGIGSSVEKITTFTKVKGLPTDREIIKIVTDQKWTSDYLSIVLLEDGSVWCTGTTFLGEDGTYFTEVINSTTFESKVIDIEATNSTNFLVALENGEVYQINKTATKTKIEGLNDIVQIETGRTGTPIIAKNSNGEYFIYGTLSYSYLGLDADKLKNDNGTYKSLVAVNDVVPEEMLSNNDKIKEIVTAYPTSTTQNYYYIMESGDVWGTGAIDNLGLGDEYISSAESSRADLQCLIDANGNNGSSTLNNVKIISTSNEKIEYCSAARKPLILIDENNNMYTTGNQNIMYRNSILQTSWKHLASDVEKVFIGGDDRLAYVDSSNNGYVVLSDYREIGINSISTEVVKGNNFRKITDSNLENKVSEIHFSEGAIFVLSTENNLYTAGKGKFDTTWVQNAYSGLGEEALEKQTLLKENVQNVATVGSGTIISGNILASDNNLYFWGRQYYQGLGLSFGSYNTLTNISVTGIDFSKIKKMKIGWVRTHIITDSGEVFTSGVPAGCGLGEGSDATSIVTMQKFNIDEKIVDIQYATSSHYDAIMLTENGDVYGWGNEQVLGKNANTSNVIGIPEKLSISDVKSIHGMAEGFVVVKNDGTVWGTGFNTYGVLGRWSGVGRGESNSRYKTALNWVECPELEF